MTVIDLVKLTKDIASELGKPASERTNYSLKGIFEKYLDAHPCSHCGGHYDDHLYLTDPEIEAAKRDGYIVNICNENIYRSPQRGSTNFLRLSRPIEDPCDEEFMKDISS